MGRTPCCAKLGLKKGPWTAEEDEIMKNHILEFGHANWRALPKLAGLLRCGKSCRLRWVNYLRPDIKRGGFTKEEEDRILDLHVELGNKWSLIAAKLPGRTDNEIKNVWHTSLKKRLYSDDERQKKKRKPRRRSKKNDELAKLVGPVQKEFVNSLNQEDEDNNSSLTATSAEQSFSEFSSLDSNSTATMMGDNVDDLVFVDEISCFSSNEFPESLFDEPFWIDQDLSLMTEEIQAYQPSFHHTLDCLSSASDNDVDFWLKVFGESGGWQGLPEI